MIFKLGGYVHDPQSQLDLYIYSQSLHKYQFIFEKYYLWNTQTLKIQSSRKDARRRILKIRFLNSWTSWIWDHYLSKKHEIAFSSRFNSIEGIPPYSDSHPCISPPLVVQKSRSTTVSNPSPKVPKSQTLPRSCYITWGLAPFNVWPNMARYGNITSIYQYISILINR